jgi:phenylacetate-CoA ligase
VWPPYDLWCYAAVTFDVVAVAWSPRSAVLARQRRRLDELLQVAAARSAPYRERLGGSLHAPEGRPLASIAPVCKAELMSRFDEWVTDPRVRREPLLRFVADPSCIGDRFGAGFTVWSSSGSSGEQGLFVQDERAMAVYDALEAFRRPGWSMAAGLAPRIAFVGATTGHYASTVSIERLRRLAPWLADSVRGFSFLSPPQELARALDAFAPGVVATYPTTALQLAGLRHAGRLSIRPAALWTGGETLTPSIRRRLQHCFRCPVRDSYGASEFLAMATECGHGHLHLNDDWCILEPVDEHRQPVPEGRAGHTTLLTNLANHLQPLIRYDIGDRVSLHGASCPCGSPLTVVKVEGRNDDLLLLRDERRRAVPVPPLALTTVLEEEAGVFDFQLEQTDDDVLELRIGPAEPAGPAAMAHAESAVRRYLERLGLAHVRVQAVRDAGAACLQSGKRRRIIALVRGSPRPRSRHRGASEATARQRAQTRRAKKG